MNFAQDTLSRRQQASGTAASNTAVVVTVAAPAGGGRHFFFSIIYSYSATPTGGRLSTTGLAGDELDIDIYAAGSDMVVFPPLPIEYNVGFSVTLAAGGSGVVGKLTVCYDSYP